MTDVFIQSTWINNVSALVFSGDLNEPAPLVFFVHGVASDKRQGIPLGYELAKRGIVCANIDTIL